ncbi:MAG: flavin reductase family protein [Bacteroidota bacterium]
MTFDVNDLTPRETYRFLAGAVAPRPICFASTISAAGVVNLSPYSFFNVVSADPPLLAFSPLLSGKDGSRKDTLNNVLEVPEVVINIVSYGFVEQMSQSSAPFPPEVNEFNEVALTQVPSTDVRPPRVGESPVAFECTVDRVIPLGDGPMGGNLVLARVVRIHVQEAFLTAEGKLDATNLNLVGRMGGNDYVRTVPEALFILEKP